MSKRFSSADTFGRAIRPGLTRQGLSGVDEVHRDRVEAVALAGRRRAIGEDVAEVAATAGASDLGAGHAVAMVLDERDLGAVDRLEEAGPAGARLELRLRREKRQSAQAADVGPLLLVVDQVAAKRWLGAVIQQYPPLFLVQGLCEVCDLLLAQRRDVIANSRDRGAGRGDLGGLIHHAPHRW